MYTIKRRALVLTEEGAGHPFRRSLPSHVFTRPCDGEAPAEPAPRWKLSGADWRGFFSAYCLAFVAVSLFIA